MSIAVFNRDSVALFYAKQHLKTDAAVKKVVYLPKNSPEREMRFIEVNDLISERGLRQLVPIDFGIDRGLSTFHSLLLVPQLVIDSSPNSESPSHFGIVRFV